MHLITTSYQSIATLQILLFSLIAFISGITLGTLIFGRLLRERLNSDEKQTLRKARELQETQEQLTITNEELQTSKEEMESAIEELSILNENLKTRNQELNELNDKLTALKYKYNQIIEATPAAIFTINEDNRLVSLNDATRRLAIWTGEEKGVGSLIKTVFHERFLHNTDFLKSVEEALQDKKISIQKEISFVDDKGKENHYEFIACRISPEPEEVNTKDQGNNIPRQVLIIIRDTTVVRLLVKDLEQREEFMRNIVKTAPAAIITVGPNGTVAFANTGAETFFGRSSDEMTGANLDDLHPQDSDLRITMDEIAAKKLENRETVILRKDGSEAPAILNASPLPGKNNGFILVYADATPLKELEASLQKQIKTDKQKAQTEKLEALGEVSSGIAQEINSVMDRIHKAVGGIIKNTKDTKILEGLQQIELLSEEGYRSTARIRDYIGNSSVLACRETALDSTVEQALNETSLRGSEYPHIELNYTSSCNKLVHMERDNIIECVSSVIYNALEAMPTGGKLDIRTSATDCEAVVEIRDNGTGMDRETLEKAFNPYFSTKKEEGAGLGLTTVRSILQRNNGGITIESTKGKGTTIKLRFPLV